MKTLPKPKFVAFVSYFRETLKEASVSELYELASQHETGAIQHTILQELDSRPKPVVTIRYSRSEGEFRVPSPDKTEAGAYYTYCEQDARVTAHAMHGDRISIRIRRKA